ncbi:MAG: group II intron reverse transcriptase/maturase [bacterium]
MDLQWMREAHRRTRKDGAVGVDGQTAEAYAEHLDDNLRSLLEQAKSGSYRAPPVRRVHIPKGDGGSETRPIGVPTFEDKVLQRAVAMLLEPIYEEEFYDLSYGFRRGRSAHDALEALDQGIWSMGGGWVVDMDVRRFFDTMDHGELQALLRKRVVDGVVMRLIGKWLHAGVLEEGRFHRPSAGTPQGGVISPILANVYLHHVLDRWWSETVLPHMRGRASLVRYADDAVLVFSDKRDAERVHAVLPKRFARFGLAVHPEKTRLISFCRPRQDGGGLRPGSFDFLGFTHYWARSRKGRWVPKRKTASKRFSRSLRAVNQEMRRVRHASIQEQSRILGQMIRGFNAYYGIRGNSRSLSAFLHEARGRWKKWLSRRSHKAWVTWEAFDRMERRFPLPRPRMRKRQLQLANL